MVTIRSAAAVLVIVTGWLPAAEPAKKPLSAEPWKKTIAFIDDGGAWSGPAQYSGDFQTNLDEVIKDKNGNLVANGAQMMLHRVNGPLTEHLKGINFGQVVIHYPPLREKDIIAAMGYLYRAGKLGLAETVGPLKFSGGIALDWVPDKDAPPGVSVQWDSLIIPMETRYGEKTEAEGCTEIHGHVLWVEKVELPKAKDADPKKIVAHLGIHEEGPGAANKIRFQLKAGDILLIGKAGHKVRKIVPPDAKTQVIGWVELEFKPIPEADLIKDKIPFVRPEKK